MSRINKFIRRAKVMKDGYCQGCHVINKVLLTDLCLHVINQFVLKF